MAVPGRGPSGAHLWVGQPAHVAMEVHVILQAADAFDDAVGIGSDLAHQLLQKLLGRGKCCLGLVRFMDLKEACVALLEKQ